MSESTRVVGTVGLVDDPTALIAAATRVRDAGYTQWDCHTPYPVHGLDQAMGLADSKVPTIALSAGLLGVIAAVALQGYISVVQYPINIGGKPLFAWPAFVPIMFELFVLFAALATISSVVIFGRLARWHSPLHDSNVMANITCDRFCIVLDARDTNYDADTAATLLREAGCSEVQPLVEKQEQGALL